MATTVRLLTKYILSGVPYNAGDLVSIDDALATLLVDGKIADNAAAAISQAGAEGEVIQYPAVDVLTYGKGARPASEVLYYDYLSQRPTAAAYGVGICQVGAIAYISDGSTWTFVGRAPYILAQSAMPMILPSSGTIGVNGALSGITALPIAYANCYMWFPTGAINAGSTAGMYYVEMSSTTAGTIYNNTYTSGVPTIPTKVAFSGTSGIAYTQTTASDITVTSNVIPANILGINGQFSVNPNYSTPNNANSKTIRINTNSIAIVGTVSTTTVNNGCTYVFKNRGVLNKNYVNPSLSNAFGGGTSGSIASVSIDTTADMTSNITFNIAVATDFMVLESVVILVNSS